MRMPWLTCLAAALLGAMSAGPARAAGDDDDGPPADGPEPAAPRPLFDWPLRRAAVAPGELDRPLLFDDHDAPDAPFPTPCAPAHTGTFTFSAGAAYVRPQYESNPAFLLTRRGTSKVVEFGPDAEAAPLAALAYTAANGWGVRARYFHFNGGTSETATGLPGDVVVTPATPLLPGQLDFPGGNIVANSNLFVDAYDVEATRAWTKYRWWVQLGAGVRYAHLSQEYAATVTTPLDVAVATSSHGFNGAGPLLSLDFKRQLGDCCLALYGGARGAALFGSYHEEFFADINGVNPQVFARRFGRVVSVAEVEVGLELCRDLGPCRVFTQAGFLGQVWWNGGTASNFDPAINDFTTDNTFGFVGVALRAGVSF